MLSEANVSSATNYLLQTVCAIEFSMISHSFLDCSFK